MSRLALIEKEASTKTFTIMQAGGAFNLTGYAVTFLARDKNAAKGALFITKTATITNAVGGVVTVAFIVVNTTMPTAGDDMKGEFTFKLTNGGIARFTKFGIFHLQRNDFEA